MAESFQLLFRLFYQPATAMSAILDRGSLLAASLMALAASAGLAGANERLQFPFYGPFLVLAAAFVPGVLLLCILFGNWGGFVASFSRDYPPLLTCAAMAWTAANLPLVLAARTAPFPVFAGLAGLFYLYFAVLMFFAVRTIFGSGNGATTVIILLSPVAAGAAVFALLPLRFILGMVASPFFLFYAWYYLGGEVSHLGAGMRNRQSFRRALEAAAVNPHDGEAQYQLGLIYQQRRNYSEAIRRFQEAVKIDPSETDAHFQLGRIAREQGRNADALKSFEMVLQQNPKHNLNEILREAGATLFAAGRTADAALYLEQYVEVREYDPEGLYWYGQALESMGKTVEARQMYARAVEAARTAPRHRRHFTARWSRLAQRREGKLAH